MVGVTRFELVTSSVLAVADMHSSIVSRVAAKNALPMHGASVPNRKHLDHEDLILYVAEDAVIKRDTNINGTPNRTPMTFGPVSTTCLPPSTSIMCDGNRL